MFCCVLIMFVFFLIVGFRFVVLGLLVLCFRDLFLLLVIVGAWLFLGGACVVLLLFICFVLGSLFDYSVLVVFALLFYAV